LFYPRPQVKNPRACNKCQGKRQQANEREWRERNKQHLPNKHYHRLRRLLRIKKLKDLAAYLSHCLEVGMRFANLKGLETVGLKDLAEYFSQFLHNLGIRAANKFIYFVKGLCQSASHHQNGGAYDKC